MEEIRLLSKEDIDVRVAQTNIYNNNGQQVVKVNLLLYKDARVDMKILDELFTPMGWKRTHKLIGDRLYCSVEVFNEKTGEWICKEDVGVESNTEAEKGQASDSFKRACVNWGIGRELYTAPKISVTLNEREYTRGQDGRIKVWASFAVKSIGYDAASRTITSLEIEDKDGNVRFSMGTQAVPKQPSAAVQARRVSSKRPAKKAEAAPAPVDNQQYQPLSDEAYWKIVKAFAEGRKTKTGGDYRQTWIEMTHAKEGHIIEFDRNVENYRFANNINH